MEYEFECEYDFSNLTPMLLTITFHTNLVPIVSFSTCHQQGGEGPLEYNWIVMRKPYSDLTLYLYSNLRSLYCDLENTPCKEQVDLWVVSCEDVSLYHEMYFHLFLAVSAIQLHVLPHFKFFFLWLCEKYTEQFS